jgi:hypothetical protein
VGDGFGKDVTVQGEIAQAERQAERQALRLASPPSRAPHPLISPDTLYSLSLLKPTFLLYRCALKVVGFTFRCGACFVPRVTTAKL